MMKIRIAVVALATGMSPALAAPISVALVEGVSGAPAGVEFMDYVETDNMAVTPHAAPRSRSLVRALSADIRVAVRRCFLH